MQVFALGFWSGLGLALPLGPMAILLITTTMARGKRAGALGASAMASVDFSYAVLVFAVGSVVLQAISPLVFTLRVIGSLVLVWVAFQIYRNAKKVKLEAKQVDGSATRSGFSTYATFFGLTVINPATAFYFLAITPSVAQVSAGSGLTWNVLAFGLGVFTGSAIWQFTLVGAANFFSKHMSATAQRRMQYAGAGLIAVLAVWLLIK